LHALQSDSISIQRIYIHFSVFPNFYLIPFHSSLLAPGPAAAPPTCAVKSRQRILLMTLLCVDSLIEGMEVANCHYRRKDEGDKHTIKDNIVITFDW
jgi:hypothetical protein